MQWIKQGRVFSGCHTQLPIVKKYGVLRVYFSDRSTDNKSLIRYVELNSDNPKEVLSPVVTVLHPSYGFDANGVMTASILEVKGKTLLYYTGWSTGEVTPYKHSIGVAVSNDGVKFDRSSLPVMQSSEIENFICSSPFVISDGVFRMWYISGKDCGWSTLDGNKVPLYKMAYAESQDGFHWHDKAMSFPRTNEREVFARPFIAKDGKYRMWSTYMEMKKPKRYRIGYAESDDGLSWTVQGQ